MPSNAFTPSKLDVINQVLTELGRSPVDNAAAQVDPLANQISARLDTLLPELLLRTNWNWAIKFVTDNSPITQNLSTEYTYTFQLPPDYGRMFRLYDVWYDYTIMDYYLLANQRPVMYYYVVNSVDYDVIAPLFERTLALYCASTLCLSVTNNMQLTAFIKNEYKEKLIDAILQNSMDARIVSAPNDFDRVQII